MSQVLKFEITDYELEEISDSQFMKLRTKIVSSGMNKHKLPIKIDTIKRASASLFGKPLLFKYNDSSEDFLGHEKTEISCGVYIDKNSFSFVEDEENPEKQWLVADCVVWKHYYPEVVEVFKKREDIAISMEIEVLEFATDENGFNEIKEFVFRGVTLLGKLFSPAIPNANATVLSFSEMKEEAIKEFNIHEDADLESSDAIKETENSDFSICGELENTEQAIDKEGEVMFNKENFAASIEKTANEVWEMLSGACSQKKYVDGDYEYSQYWMRDYDSSFVYTWDYVNNCGMALPYSFEDGNAVVDFEGAKKASMRWIVEDEDEEENGLMELIKKLLELQGEKMTADFVSEKEQMTKDFEKNKEDMNAEFAVKTSELESIAEELKAFKANVELQEFNSQVDFAIESVRVDLTAEQVDEWREKSKEFTSVDAFSNALKAFAYDVRVQKNPTEKEEFSRMEVTKETTTITKNKKSIWA